MGIWGGFRRPAATMAFALGCAALVGCTSGSSGGAGKSPEAVVALYLASMKAGDYATAYDLLTPHMVRDEGKLAWIAEQTAIMKIADVKISSFEVFPARIDGGEAIVPNLLKSTDKFINQGGANEYELYTLVRGQDGAWKIRLQQLVESDAVEAWFPERVRE